MKFSFRLWLEADEDFLWYVYASGNHKRIKDVLPKLNQKQFAESKQIARAAFQKADPTLAQSLKPEFLNSVVNYFAFMHYNWCQNSISGWLSAKEKIGVNTNSLNSDETWQQGWELFKNRWTDQFLLPTRYPSYQNIFHVNANNPKFFQALQAVKNEEELVVNLHTLKKDSERSLRVQQKSSTNSRIGPEGRTLIQFPDGFQWLSLDKSFCDKEGKAGMHCGNILGQNPSFQDDVILSLRDSKGAVEATFVINNGNLSESKGPGNNKISERFYPYIAKLFLSNSPPPLPIKTNFHYFKSKDRPIHMPHKDTTVIDLLASDNVDSNTKEQLKNKFQTELNNKDIIDEYLKYEMDDKHRKKVIDILGYGDFESSKNAAIDKALQDMDWFLIDPSQAKDYQNHSEEIIQILDHNIKEFKKLLNGQWKKFGNNIMTKLNNLDIDNDFYPNKFMYEFNPDVVKYRRENPYYDYDYNYRNNDEEKDNDLKYYHPKVENDNPERRAIKKTMKKFFQTVLTWLEEINQSNKSVRIKEKAKQRALEINKYLNRVK